MKIELSELHDKYSLPSISGIYFIFAGSILLYIGMSNCISNRLSLSRIMKEFLRFGVSHFYIFPYYEEDIHNVELQLIKMFDPPVNKLSITAKPKDWIYNPSKRQARKIFSE